MPRRGNGKTGAGFWEDLGDPSRYINEIVNDNSDSQKLLRTLGALSTMFGGGHRRGGQLLHPPKRMPGWAGNQDARVMRGMGRYGGDFWSDLGDGNKWLNELTNPSSYLNHHFDRGAQVVGALAGMGRGRGKPRGPSRRGAIVKQVMTQHPGMSLPQASAYVKQHGLYQ
jgi:hypothetical protein